MNSLTNMYARLQNRGGEEQQDRMIKDKQRTLQRAVQYSYQGAKVQLVNSDKIVPALMNPNKLLADYDEKTISIDYQYGFKVGEVFRWINPSQYSGDTYWLIYLQDLTELAYFRADVRKCSYVVEWLDQDGVRQKTYAAIRGPKEQQIQSVMKSQFIMDIPNYTITLLMPKNSDTIAYFTRYTKFYLQSLQENNTPICWRVEAIDSISLPGVLEIHAKEYYSNDDMDDVEQGLVDAKIETVLEQEQIDFEAKGIVGDNFIKPGFTYTYQGIGTGTWVYDTALPILANIRGEYIDITWTAAYSGDFILQYGNNNKTIIVESLF